MVGRQDAAARQLAPTHRRITPGRLITAASSLFILFVTALLIVIAR